MLNLHLPIVGLFFLCCLVLGLPAQAESTPVQEDNALALWPGLSQGLTPVLPEHYGFLTIAEEQNTIGNQTPDALPVSVSYSQQAFQLKTHDNTFALSIQNRIQFRYANPFDSDPRSLQDLEREQGSFMIRRARTKLNGHAYWPWLKYSMQYDWKDAILRDFNLSIDPYPWARLWVGRGKIVYNDERVTSSARQQFVNRSIVNDLFTVDRQEGVQLSGQLFPGTWHDLSYAVGVFTGLGVGLSANDDGNMMYSGRLQWNILGGEMPFSQSDILPHQHPALNIAVAAATNQSKCTAFSTAGNSCLSLPGLTVGEAGQYRINQLMQELRFKWQGLSINHELHWKQVIDNQKTLNALGREVGMVGGLVQVGYFPHAALPFIPENFELAGRYAFVAPDVVTPNLQQEISGVMTYFLKGHEHKLSLQVSHLSVAESRSIQGVQRLWMQWELSF